MNTEKLNEYVFSQMVLKRAKEIARDANGNSVLPTEQHIQNAYEELASEKAQVLKVIQSRPGRVSALTADFSDEN
ncbi:hypothetical protein [Janthinobacterium fluminis]|uniref:DNA-directed RNA polymerase n=1 Tax=Janthinobacterium fluminis TaxID=2987524 RepID=A0ABT5K236_9BURK|nr:hypothetical protein [Janthinobacterium fluminis]MDC8759047.1 hypothetical protein [Janthinobacterium fluminis]